jgi:hypothetical protein
MFSSCSGPRLPEPAGVRGTAWKGILPVARIGYPWVIPILTESLSGHEQLR